MASGSLNVPTARRDWAARRDLGLFGPDSMIWRVNREAVVTLAGTCALLMQLAHPQVAAGVRDHSRFAEDTAGRLRRTLDLTMTIVFGPRAAALQAVRVINARHRTINGPGYSALDPELLLWVHATLVYSALQGYQAFVGPLSPMDRDRYYQDTKEIGVLLGIPGDTYPVDIDAFDAYLWRMIDQRALIVGGDARRMAAVVLRPRFPAVPRAAFAPVTVLTAGLLPALLREAYGLKWGRIERLAFAACRVALPRLLVVTPRAIRFLPPTRRAYAALRRGRPSAEPAFRSG